MTIAARATQLSKTYGSGSAKVVALDSVDFEVHSGEFTAIMGPSGSGKSTLMHLLAALDSPSDGQVFLGETDVAGLKDNALTELRRERVGFIFQSFNLVPTLNARENIELPVSIAGKKVDREWFDRIIEVLGIEDRLTHKPAELSGGQQQRVACARALMNRPEIIFGDEPTGNLDSTSAAEVLAFLRRSVDEFGQTVVMVTHDAGAASYADRAVFLKDGRIIHEMRDATQEELLAAMARIYPRQDVGEETQTAVGSPAEESTDDVVEPEPAGQAADDSAPEDLDALDDTADEQEVPVEETTQDGEESPALYRDGGTEPHHAAEGEPESDAEISAPRRAVQD